MINFKKLLVSIIAALVGLIFIPILVLDFSVKILPILLIYFLPGFSFLLIILFEVLTRVRGLKVLYDFIQGIKVIVLFMALLIIESIIIWKVHPMNDVVFVSQFATAIIPAIIVYDRLGKRWNVFTDGEVRGKRNPGVRTGH